MVLRLTPASRSQKLSVPNTSSSGKPAENPSDSIRRLAGSWYTLRLASQPGRSGLAVLSLGSLALGLMDE